MDSLYLVIYLFYVEPKLRLFAYLLSTYVKYTKMSLCIALENNREFSIKRIWIVTILNLNYYLKSCWISHLSTNQASVTIRKLIRFTYLLGIDVRNSLNS